MFFFFFQAEDVIRVLVRSRGLGDVYKRQVLAKLLGFNEPQREALASVRSELWAIYDALKAYKLSLIHI